MGVFYINGVNSMPFVKKCENTLDKTTRKMRRRFLWLIYLKSRNGTKMVSNKGGCGIHNITTKGGTKHGIP